MCVCVRLVCRHVHAHCGYMYAMEYRYVESRGKPQALVFSFILFETVFFLLQPMPGKLELAQNFPVSATFLPPTTGMLGYSVFSIMLSFLCALEVETGPPASLANVLPMSLYCILLSIIF